MAHRSSRLGALALLWASASFAISPCAAPAAAASAAPTWAPPVNAGQVAMTGGGFVSQIESADFNADGIQDLIFTRSVYQGQQTFPVTVLLGDGHAKFNDATQALFDGNVPVTQNARELGLADFNGDGRTDVFVADHGDDQYPFPGYQDTLILSAPGGKLVNATANLPQVSDFTHSGAAGDVNRDGAADIYVGNVGAGVPPRILLNDGSGHFSVATGALPPDQTNHDLNQYTSSLFLDVNSDGKLDLVLGGDNTTPNSVVLLNDGAGNFARVPTPLPPKPFGPDALTYDISAEDVNGDGIVDLLLAYTKAIPPGQPISTGRWVQVLIGNGDGTFRDETNTRLPQTDNDDTWATFIQQRDLNRDGRNDFGLRVGGGGGGSPLLYLLDPASGVFSSVPSVDIPNQLWTFIDAEGDGSNDIASVNPGNGAVSLSGEVRGQAGPPPPPTDTTAPTVSALRVRPRAFRRARHAAPTLARTAIGAAVSYTLSEDATTTWSFSRAATGTRRRGLCVPARRGARGGKHCIRYVRLARTVTHFDNAGPDRLRFSGWLSGRRLTRGDYRLTVVPSDHAGNVGSAATTRFTILG
jgi:hypothetical protein